MRLEVKMNMDIDDNAREEVVKMLTHHIEWLMDLDGWKEIKTIYGVEVNPVSIDKKGEAK